MKSLFQGAALAAFFLLFATRARCDEFAIVPTGDAIYSQLAVLAPLGWTEMRTVPKTPLTRYEIATEVARAITAIRNLHNESETAFLKPATRSAVRSVHDMSEKFRPELRTLGIDASEVGRLCDEILRGSGSSDSPRREARSSVVLPRRESSTRSAPVGMRSFDTREMRMALPLSSRLQFESMVSKLSLDAADPFGDTNDTASPNAARAGVALAVNSSVSLHAFGGRTAAARNPGSRMSAAAEMGNFGRPLNAPNNSFISSGGGLSVELPRGVQLRGNYERLNDVDGSAEWKRLGGEVEVSAWRNRLSLRANWSRLLPNDTRLLPSSAGGLDVGLDVSERLRLTLLYRQLFSDRPEVATSRIVSGGININF